MIYESAKEMATGMCKFLKKKIETLQDYNEYCYYVAGLVGIGLTKLFIASELEDVSLKDDMGIINSMGLLLQKTNIIRDFYQDLNENRCFWPKEVWSIYTDDLKKLADDRTKAVKCLNHLIADAMSHIPDSLSYLSKLKTRSVFRFCAIPQVMAIATLAECYNNERLFSSNIKISRGKTAKVSFLSNLQVFP